MEQLEFKAILTAGEAGQIAGYASLFGRPADAVRDVVAPGAFNASLMLRTPEMKSEHAGPVIGVWEEVVEDEMGLRVKGRFNLDTPAGRAAYADVAAGRKDGLSIGYIAIKSSKDASDTRVLDQIELHEISVVRKPASSRSRILSVKSKEGSMPEIEKGAAPDTAALEGKIADLDKQVKSLPAVDLKPVTDRLDKLEAKASLPAAAADPKESEKLELKALSDFLRTGNIDIISSIGASFETKAAASDNNPGGGYFVLPTVDLSIRNLLTDLSPMRGLAENVTISTDQYVRFYGFGKRGAEWVSQREDRPQDTARPDAKKLTIGVSELYAAPVTTRHLLEDSAVDIASWLINNAIHDFAETEDEAWLRGDGVDGRPTGLLTYGTDAAKDFTRAWGKHQYIPAGHASAPTDANLVAACIKLVAALRKPYKGNAVWVMNSNTATRLQTITDENGRRLWAPTGNLIEGVEHPLLGYRVEIDEGMPDIGAGEHPVAFGDFRQGYVIVDRQGVRTHVDEVTRKGFVVLDTYKRVGGAAGDFNAIKFLKIAAS